ncbi:hypothetical protein C4K03_3764 [Pseudomonas synxantha]|uniref:Uncharacterized protein n=1 Tax=Pseudomonas synxantha TaxID=47883 RepID=A0A3G7U987_9PSED|nr:hypothetical protein [Pseudomonas synxantha]AZE55917.1 hypothetical protein C4K03_3764 [Pseudomonas synxantha]
MTIDKQKLQKLLWSEVASWKSDCSEWKQSSEALGEFLGEKTTEEVALELLAENEALRKDAARYRFLCDKFGETKLPCVLERILAGDLYVADGKSSIDSAIDAAMGKGEQS